MNKYMSPDQRISALMAAGMESNADRKQTAGEH